MTFSLIQTRLDAAFGLRLLTLSELRVMATRRGLNAKGSRRVLIARIYEDAVALEDVVRFSYGKIKCQN